MNMREQRGIEIAHHAKIKETPRGFIVPSQNGNGSYLVYKKGFETLCTCPDCKKRGVKCKHQFAVDYYAKKEIDSEGNTTITKAIKITYPQDWHNYNLSQNKEMEMFSVLLKDLLEDVKEPIQSNGRPRIGLKENLFCAIEKVYSQLSSRRAHTIYREAKKKGQIDRAPNFNAINKFLNREDITPLLHRLLTLSALPLRSVETSFAQDSSGFRTSQFNQYAVEKYGQKKEHKWVKAHLLVGTKTNVIVSARITENNAGDSPQFIPMVKEAYENGFEIGKLTADMAYSSRANLDYANEIGATAYIPFRRNATGNSRGSYIWKKMFNYFQLNQEEFMSYYHARSNAETTFMAVKTKFGDKLKSKNWTAQRNELLCKFIAYNIVVLIHEVHELGIEARF